MDRKIDVEQLLLDDARRPQAPADARIALQLLRPHIARAAHEAARRKRQRQETLIFLMALLVFSIFASFAVYALLKGNDRIIKGYAAPVCLLSLGTLLMLPLLERFLPREHRG